MAIAVSPPNPTEAYTEFYVLDDDGDAEGYPTNLTVGETGRVIVGVSNHEHDDRTYTVAVVLEDRTLENRTLTVRDERTADFQVDFSASQPGRKRLVFLLYEGEETTGEPYRKLRLWLDISAK
jgi:uncharacterized membrane protein